MRENDKGGTSQSIFGAGVETSWKDFCEHRCTMLHLRFGVPKLEDANKASFIGVSMIWGDGVSDPDQVEDVEVELISHQAFNDIDGPRIV